MAHRRWAGGCACPSPGMAAGGNGSELAQEGLQANDPAIPTLHGSICFQEASEHNRAIGQAGGPGRNGRGHTAGQGILCSLSWLIVLEWGLCHCQRSGWVPGDSGQTGARESGAGAGVSTFPSRPGHPTPRQPLCLDPGQRPSYLVHAVLEPLPKATVGPIFSGVLWEETHSAKHKVTTESAEKAWWHTAPGMAKRLSGAPPPASHLPDNHLYVGPAHRCLEAPKCPEVKNFTWR